MAVLALVWAGMVIGVSGLATPVKFEVADLTLPVALEVGNVTFQLMNKVEWALGALLLIAAIIARGPRWPLVMALIALVLLAMQSLWFLPALADRVAIVAAGGTLPPASYHMWYVLSEAMKLIVLLALGIAAIRRAIPQDQRL